MRSGLYLITHYSSPITAFDPFTIYHFAIHQFLGVGALGGD
jgi:hypothetical protein